LERTEQLPEDLSYLRALIANVIFIGKPDSQDWVLVDTGIATFADNIRNAARERFGDSRPKAILLTHGHFDHVGSIEDLLADWDVPVYAHEKELPYLTGRADYPPGDPLVGGGLMAAVSPLYPHRGIDLGTSVKALPGDGSAPFLPEWKWIATPGHTQGHISLFRDKDKALIAGDAFITVKQESALEVMTQHKEIHGPPAYFTPDWKQSWDSVKRLEQLKPEYAITGHGLPMAGEELRRGLEKLSRDFDKMAIPDQGRYVRS